MVPREALDPLVAQFHTRFDGEPVLHTRPVTDGLVELAGVGERRDAAGRLVYWLAWTPGLGPTGHEFRANAIVIRPAMSDPPTPALRLISVRRVS